MVDAVAAPQASLTTRVNALVVLSAMLYAAGMLSAALLLSATLTHVAHLKDIGQSTHCYIMLCAQHDFGRTDVARKQVNNLSGCTYVL